VLSSLSCVDAPQDVLKDEEEARRGP